MGSCCALGVSSTDVTWQWGKAAQDWGQWAERGLSPCEALVRPQLQYCGQLWVPIPPSTVELWDRDQRRAVKMPKAWSTSAMELGSFGSGETSLQPDLVGDTQPTAGGRAGWALTSPPT